MDLGGREKFPTIWSLLGWSGCERRKLPSWGDTKGLVIEHVSLAQATRKDSSKGFNKKARHGRAPSIVARQWATWLLGGRGGHIAHAAMLSSNSRLSWPLGPRLGVSFAKGIGSRLAQCSYQ